MKAPQIVRNPARSEVIRLAEIQNLADDLPRGCRRLALMDNTTRMSSHYPCSGSGGQVTGENDNYRLNMLKTLIAAGADPAATNEKGETPLQAMTRLRAEAEPSEPTDPQGFRKACFQAKLDYLRTLR